MLKDFIAARAQLATFILFVLTIYFIEQFLDTKKKRYVIGLILIPILIANLHVAVFPFYFVLYVPYIFEYMIYILSYYTVVVNEAKIKSLNKKLNIIKEDEKLANIKEKISKLEKENERIIARKEKRAKNPYKLTISYNNNVKPLIIIMIICLLTGFITPLGTTPYTYLVKTMMGNTTKNISEHLPLVLINNSNYMCVLAIFILILAFTDTKIRLCDLFMLMGLTLLAFATRRQESMFIIICGFILNRFLCSLFNKYDASGAQKIEEKMTTFIGMVTTIAIVLTISITTYKPKVDDDFVDENTYPVMAADYILNNLDLNNIKLYNEYNYGSYLLFRGIPVFIDSRADLYSPEFNEGVDVFTDFLNLSGVNNDEIEETLDKYGITHLIMYKDSKLRTFIKQNTEKYVEIYGDEPNEIDDHFCIYERKQVNVGK